MSSIIDTGRYRQLYYTAAASPPRMCNLCRQARLYVRACKNPLLAVRMIVLVLYCIVFFMPHSRRSLLLIIIGVDEQK